MKLFLIAGVLALGTVAVNAQSLDIGGIELHLGQKVDEALSSLPPSYQVEHINGTWFVSQKAGNLYQFLGSMSATANTVSSIIKFFDTSLNAGGPNAYTRASKELRRRGGTTCATREAEYTDDLIRGFETQCGPYKLSYHMPSKTADGAPVLEGVAILLIRKQ